MTAAPHLRELTETRNPQDDLNPVRAAERMLSDTDRIRLEGYVAEILEATGLDLDTPGTVNTPRRFLQALFDATDGYEGDPKLLTAFPTECHEGASCELAQIVE